MRLLIGFAQSGHCGSAIKPVFLKRGDSITKVRSDGSLRRLADCRSELKRSFLAQILRVGSPSLTTVGDPSSHRTTTFFSMADRFEAEALQHLRSLRGPNINLSRGPTRCNSRRCRRSRQGRRRPTHRLGEVGCLFHRHTNASRPRSGAHASLSPSLRSWIIEVATAARMGLRAKGNKQHQP